MRKSMALAKTAFAVAQTEGSSAKLASKEAAEKNRQAKEAMERSVAQVGLDPAMDFQSFQRNEEELSALEQQITRYEQERHTVEEQYRAYEAELEGKSCRDVPGLRGKADQTAGAKPDHGAAFGRSFAAVGNGKAVLGTVGFAGEEQHRGGGKVFSNQPAFPALVGEKPIENSLAAICPWDYVG